MLEVKGGYFFFSQSKLRKVYDNGGEDVQLGLTVPLWKQLNLYLGGEFLERRGRSLNDHQRTRIREFPISLGLKPTFSICSILDWYLNIGPKYFFVYMKNNSDFVNRHRDKNGLGGFVGTGILLHPARSKYFFLDIFGEYSYKRMHFHSDEKNVIGHSAQIGGFVFGGGLGYSF